MPASHIPRTNQMQRCDRRRRWSQRPWALLAWALVALVLVSCGQSPTVPGDEAGPASHGDKDLRFERLLGPMPGTTSGGIRTSSIDGSDLELVRTIGVPPTGPGEFAVAANVAVSSDGIVYVSDFYEDRVQRFDATGGYLGEWGYRGVGDGAFEKPAAIAVDPTGQVFVVEEGNQRIQRFAADGTFERAWGAGSGQSIQGASIAVAPTNREVFVGDHVFDRVHVFDPDGGHLRSWGSRGGGVGELWGPRGIVVGTDGSVYISDLINRVQRFDTGGTYVGHWGTFGFVPRGSSRKSFARQDRSRSSRTCNPT